MATPLPYQFATTNVNGQTVYNVLPQENLPSGYTPISLQQFISGVQAQDAAPHPTNGTWSDPHAGLTTDVWNQLLAGNTQSPYTTGANGTVVPISSTIPTDPALIAANMAKATFVAPQAPTPQTGTTIQGTNGQTYTLGSPEYTKYLLGTPLGTPATVNQNYWLQPGETIQQYNDRLAKLSLPSGATSNGNSSANIPAPSVPSTLSSSTMAPSTVTNYQTSPPLSSYNTSVPNTYIADAAKEAGTLSQPENDLQKMIDDTTKLISQDATKDTYQKEQNLAQDIKGKTALVNDLGSQIDMLAQNAANIQASQQAAGSGVTSAIDQRQRQEALRLNSINSLQIQAQYNVAKGKLGTAQALADQAVNLKFDPIEDQIKAAQANIAMLKDSPNITLAEQKRADARSLILNQQASAIAQQKQDAQDIFTLVKTAMTNGLIDPTILNNVNKVTSLAQAEQMLAPYLKTPLTGSGTEQTEIMINGVPHKVLINSTTGATVKDLGVTAKAPPAKAPSTSVPSFTPTQVNSGAVKAGTPVATFSTLAPDVQSYFVASTPTQIKAITNLLSQVKAGTETTENVKTMINEANTTQAVKDYWTQKLAEVTPAPQQTSFLGDVWNSVKTWFSNI